MSSSPGISDRIRALAAEGLSRAEIARRVDRSYQQVRQVLVADEARARRARSAQDRPARTGGVSERDGARFDAPLPPLPVRLEVDGAGRVPLPRSWKVRSGQVFVARKFGTSIVLMDIADASEAARAGGSLESAADELIAERRLEAMREFDD